MRPAPDLPVPAQIRESLADLKGPRLCVAESLERITTYFIDEGGGFELLAAFMKAHFSDEDMVALRRLLVKYPHA